MPKAILVRQRSCDFRLPIANCRLKSGVKSPHSKARCARETVQR
jgi:hypothetical protein